jgi:hypothetical protein
LPDAIEANRKVFEDFMKFLHFVEHEGLDRRKGRKNLIANDTPLVRVQEELLTKLKIRRLEDSRTFAALLRLIQVHLGENPNDMCPVFLMSEGHKIRRAYENDRIKELFQGVQYDKQGITYPGDREIKVQNQISLQLRYLELRNPNSPPIADSVPHVAVWVPASIARDLVDQPQGGSRG